MEFLFWMLILFFTVSTIFKGRKKSGELNKYADASTNASLDQFSTAPMPSGLNADDDRAASGLFDGQAAQRPVHKQGRVGLSADGRPVWSPLQGPIKATAREAARQIREKAVQPPQKGARLRLPTKDSIQADRMKRRKTRFENFDNNRHRLQGWGERAKPGLFSLKNSIVMLLLVLIMYGVFVQISGQIAG